MTRESPKLSAADTKVTLFLSQVRPPDQDKEMLEMDALSLIILELNYSRPFDPESDSVQVSFAGKYSQESSC